MKVLKAKQVVALTGLSRVTIWRYELADIFPKRIQIGLRRVGWIDQLHCGTPQPAPAQMAEYEPRQGQAETALLQYRAGGALVSHPVVLVSAAPVAQPDRAAAF